MWFLYVGQSGRCLNDRLREHAYNVKKKNVFSELVVHLEQCRGCAPLFGETSVLAVERDKGKRVLRESIEMATRGNVISNPSFCLVPPLRRLLGI